MDRTLDYFLKKIIRFMEFLILKKYNNLHFTKKGIKIVKLDITNYRSVFNFISKTKLDEIYHLASLSQVALSFEKPLKL